VTNDMFLFFFSGKRLVCCSGCIIYTSTWKVGKLIHAWVLVSACFRHS